MVEFDNIWQVTPETAHPRARQLLCNSIVWDFSDDDSPLGTDIGADTFAAYLRLVKSGPRLKIAEFIRDQMASLGLVQSEFDAMDEVELQSRIDAGVGPEMMKFDDFIVGLAFSQLLLDGRIDEEIKYHARRALKRQCTDVVLRYRGGSGEVGRVKQLAEFDQVLQKA